MVRKNVNILWLSHIYIYIYKTLKCKHNRRKVLLNMTQATPIKGTLLLYHISITSNCITFALHLVVFDNLTHWSYVTNRGGPFNVKEVSYTIHLQYIIKMTKNSTIDKIEIQSTSPLNLKAVKFFSLFFFLGSPERPASSGFGVAAPGAPRSLWTSKPPSPAASIWATPRRRDWGWRRFVATGDTRHATD